MILKGIGFFDHENDPKVSEKNGKTYYSCVVKSINKASEMMISLECPLKEEISKAHFPKVEFTIDQKIFNGKNGTFVRNELVELRIIK